MKKILASLFAIFSITTVTMVEAEDEVLKFRLVVRNIETAAFDAPVDGHSVISARSAGVAVFDDGRIANKEFVGIVDNAGATGTWSGYSIYTFLSGDSIKLKYAGAWGADGNAGDYEILSGTGAYEGVSGTGRLVGAKNPWENANLFDVTLNIKR